MLVKTFAPPRGAELAAVGAPKRGQAGAPVGGRRAGGGGPQLRLASCGALLTRPGRPPDEREGPAVRSRVRGPGRGLTRGVVGWGSGAAAPLLPVT